jgi:hypothetical protein
MRPTSGGCSCRRCRADAGPDRTAFYNMTPTDHAGVDNQAPVLVKVKGGDWKLVK